LLHDAQQQLEVVKTELRRYRCKPSVIWRYSAYRQQLGAGGLV